MVSIYILLSVLVILSIIVFYVCGGIQNYFHKFVQRRFLFLKNDISSIVLLHYSGKFKPWSVMGATIQEAVFFQNLYSLLLKVEIYIFEIKSNMIYLDVLKANY